MVLSLQDIFHDLTSGEFAQLNIGGKKKGAIEPENYPILISHINLALLDLYTKFQLSEKEIALDLYDWMSDYKLSSKYAYTNPEEPDDGLPKYIRDTEYQPFKDDIIRIEEVFNENGSKVALNQPDVSGGAFTPRYDTIQVPESIGGATLFITYRARPTIIPTDTLSPETVEIPLPMSHRSALLFYVAWRVFASVTGQDTSAVSSEYRMKYFDEVNQIQQLNLNLENTTKLNTRIHDRGWI